MGNMVSACSRRLRLSEKVQEFANNKIYHCSIDSASISEPVQSVADYNDLQASNVVTERYAISKKDLSIRQDPFFQQWLRIGNNVNRSYGKDRTAPEVIQSAKR